MPLRDYQFEEEAVWNLP